MESASLSDTGSPEPSSDFGFAFNDVNFSDRILRIEILPDLPGEKSDPDDSIGDWARNRKRRRNDQLSNTNGITHFLCLNSYNSGSFSVFLDIYFCQFLTLKYTSFVFAFVVVLGLPSLLGFMFLWKSLFPLLLHFILKEILDTSSAILMVLLIQCALISINCAFCVILVLYFDDS